MEEKELTWLQFEYSWRWFEYHADQRLRAFYYFLIIVGFLSYGYTNQFIQPDCFLKVVFCLMGIFISLAFLRIEKRNENLVQFAREELDKLDIKIDVEIRKNDEQDKKRKYYVPISHKFWLNFIYIGSFLIFLLLFLKDVKIFKIFECIQKNFCL